MAHSIVNMINEAWEQKASEEHPFRAHLGGSMIGKTCERELTYSFRWAVRPSFEGRMLRLFDRGHKEEFRFVAFLREIGFEVREYSEQLLYHGGSDSYVAHSWEQPFPNEDLDDVTGDEFHMARAKTQGVELKQWRISDIMGHFGGSLDGIATAPFNIPVDDRFHPSELKEYPLARYIPKDTEFLLEFKTHNGKSFLYLAANGVQTAKPVHYAQMQIYMHKKNLRFALYMAVNKNDDDLYIEIVEYDPKKGPELLERAQRVVTATVLPKRIGNHESWHECKFCDYKKFCHRGEPLQKNCRSCKYSQAIEDGKWRCNKWNATIPVDAILQGCDNWMQISD